MSAIGRLDASIYDREYKSKIQLVRGYKHGTESPTNNGITISPGPSLEIKLLGTRLDSLVYKPGFYRLILPTNISEYGTLSLMQYLGTRRQLPLLQVGDVIIGEAGFQKGRSIVLVDAIERCTTNAHGLIGRRADGNLAKSIFFRCIFNWYRTMRLVDLMAVGGSGGHLSPAYFDDFVFIPRFPDNMQRKIAALYSNNSDSAKKSPTLDTFASWHQDRNASLGLWEIDRDRSQLQTTLVAVQQAILDDQPIEIPLA